MKVCKFGGTSMANSETVTQVADIVRADKQRRYVVVSAPGKRTSEDIKVTDALYTCHREKGEKGNCDASFAVIEKRFLDIEKELGVDVNMKAELAAIKKKIEAGAGADYTASRGEYLSARVLAAVLGVEFVDTADLIKFDKDGALLLDLSIDNIKARLAGVEYAVLPGFYGSDSAGEIKTFSRGGSDISGAIVARAMAASVYENWTDVDGFLTADPRIVRNPEIIECLSYKELRELAYMGAEVLHPESVFPVRTAGIPINIKNTFNPSAKGTMIVPDGSVPPANGKVITGIAGRKGFTIINIEKDMMNREIGFGRKEGYDEPRNRLRQKSAQHPRIRGHFLRAHALGHRHAFPRHTRRVSRTSRPESRVRAPRLPQRRQHRHPQRAVPHCHRRSQYGFPSRHRGDHFRRSRRQQHQHPHDRPRLLRDEHNRRCRHLRL